MDWLRDVVRDAFGHAYRFRDTDWARLARGEFYNPATASDDSIDPAKCYLIYARDDVISPIAPIDDFVDRTGCKATALKRGGHFGTFDTLSPRMFRRVSNYMRAQAH